MRCQHCDIHYPFTPYSIESRIYSLNESHIDLVNRTWKFGGDEKGYKCIKNQISNFPTCCIVDETGQPLSWVLMYYDYCAPEHRGKGYANILITYISNKIHAQGYPFYCFIEEENDLSLKLFRNLGFTENPSYRAAWFEFNY